MLFSTWIKQQTGLDPQQTMSPKAPVHYQAQADGTITITNWTITTVPEPTADQIAAILAEPEPVNSAAVKAICQDFVYSYADTNTQMNATALIASGKATSDQSSAYQAGLDWITACRAQCAKLIAAGDTNYSNQKSTYPVPSSAVTGFLGSL